MGVMSLPLVLEGCVHCFVTDGLGCSPPDVKIKSWQKIDLLTASVDGEREVNLPNWYREHEWPLFHSSKPQEPQMCLALSGGGIRSASFAVGVMKALKERRIMQKLDIVSGVSGGTYAIGWLYANLKASANWDKVFDDDGINKLVGQSRFILDNKRIGDVLTVPTKFGRRAITTTLLGSDTLLSATNEPVFGQSYAESIADTFLGGDKFLKVTEFLTIIQKQNLPFFILNATALPGRGSDYQDPQHPRMADTIVEISPLRTYGYGTGEFNDSYLSSGFYRTNQFFNGKSRRELNALHDAISISGAAIDFKEGNKFPNIVADRLGVGLGRYFPVQEVGNDYVYVYLTDGGVSDNLGVFPLVVRQCQNILAIDAEYDPSFDFGAYIKLKRALKQELGLSLSINTLDGNEGLLDRSEIDKELWGEKCGAGASCRNPKKQFDGAVPVFSGTIKGTFSVPVSQGNVETKIRTVFQKEKTLSFQYVKLSIPALEVAKLPDEETKQSLEKLFNDGDGMFVKFLGTNKSAACTSGNIKACQSPFPQYSTAHQTYSKELMRAYVQLGYYTIINHVKDAPWAK
jgi:predicted acylesterase/phospholipase RssA